MTRKTEGAGETVNVHNLETTESAVRDRRRQTII